MGRIIQKSRVLSLLKVLAVVLVLTFVSGAVPAFAETFTYETAEKGTVTISADMGDLDTDYVINAPNQKVINLAKFKSITIVNAKTYTEKVSGNTITVKNKKAKVYIDEKVKPKKITVSAKNVSIYLQKNAEVNKLIYKKANGKLNLDLKADTKVGLTLSKKSSIKITGDSSAKVDVTANVKNCIITSEVPVNVVKGKVKLETTQGTEQKPDTPSGPSDEERIKELKDSAKDNTGYSLTINHFPNKVLTTEKEVTDCIYEGCKNYTSFYLPIKDLKVLHYENYYLEKFPTLSKLVFSEVVKYSNTYYLKVEQKRKNSSFYKDEYAIDIAVLTGNTEYLTSDEKKLYNKVMKLSEKLKKSSEYETVKNIHDYMVSNIAYTSNDNDDVQYTLSGALNNFACVCSGYAKAFYFLCEASGIDTVIVTGNTKGSDLGHAWNKVKIEGKWYSIDTTWDDPVPDKPGVVEYIYFLLTDEDLAVDHIWDNSGLPEAVSDDLGYLYITYKDVLRLENDKEAMKYIMAELENAKANSSEKFTYEIEFIVKDGEDIYNNLLNLAVQYHNDFGCGYSTSGKNLKVMGRYYYIKVYK